MDVDAYSYAHRGSWNRLDFLARKGTLTGAEADELVALYRRTSQQLARLQTHSPDPELVAGLSAVLARARAKVLGTRADTWSEIGRFFTHRFPAAVYRAWPWWVSVAAMFLLVSAGIMRLGGRVRFGAFGSRYSGRYRGDHRAGWRVRDLLLRASERGVRGPGVDQ